MAIRSVCDLVVAKQAFYYDSTKYSTMIDQKQNDVDQVPNSASVPIGTGPVSTIDVNEEKMKSQYVARIHGKFG